MDEYAARLRTLAVRCSFADVDAELKSHVICSCVDSGLRRRALRDSEMSLQQLLTLARTYEATERQATQIEEGLKELHVSSQVAINRIQDKPSSSSCSNCSTSHSTSDMMSCPARGKVCNHCNKLGHFASVCQSRLAGRPAI